MDLKKKLFEFVLIRWRHYVFLLLSKLFTCFWISFVFGFFGFKMFFSLTTIRRTFIRPLWTITDFRYLSYLLKNNMTTNVHNNDDNVSLCVVGNGADGNPRSLFLDYNDHIFMFNCGEGLQRSICDLGFKPSKIDTFFSTSNRWHNYSGMTSLLLARYDSGSRHLNINNADLNQTFIQYCTVFDTKLKRLKYNYFDDKNFVYENLSIQIVPIVFGNIKTAIYLGTLRAQRGRINLEKCFHQKVPRNLVTELEQNQCVQNQYGQIIHPSDVSDPDRPEQNFLIFECIDKNYLEHLSEHKVINEFIPKCNVMVHFTNDSNLQEKSYDNFFKQHHSSHHLLITNSNPSFNLRSNYRFQLQLNQLDSCLFPCLRNTEQSPTISVSNNNDDNNVIYSPTGIKYIFRSSTTTEMSEINTDCVPQLPTIVDALQHKDGSERDGIEESIENLRKKQSSITNHSRLWNHKYPEFLFLGTASSHPLPIRNVSGILVNIDEENSILFDCGENTYGQLLNFYGQNSVAKILAKIKTIFISHHHSDHHLGLINLLEKRNQICQSNNMNKLWILLPPMVHQFIQNSKIINLNHNNHYNVVRNQFFHQFRSNIMKTLQIQQMDLIPVDHCAYAFAIGITDKRGFKFIYSGDTKPCDRLIKYGHNNCHLLIHEATVEDGLHKFAQTNFHSTISEAINVGHKMQAKFTLLTHFSQRYGKLPLLPMEQLNNDDNIGLAFDNMIISANQLHRIPLLYDTLKCMYSKHIDRIQYRTDLYERKFNAHSSSSSSSLI